MHTTMGQAVRNAIEIERQAAQFYRQLAENHHDHATRRFLEDLSAQELEHQKSIEALAANHHERLPRWHDYNVETVETPPDWSVWTQTDLRTALTIALEAEHRASLYYKAMGDTETGEVAAFFRNLATVELDHAGVLQSRLNMLVAQPASALLQPGT